LDQSVKTGRNARCHVILILVEVQRRGGRSAEKYKASFALADAEASTRILDCGGGPSSFTAEWSRRGRFVVAVDPVYQRKAAEIAAQWDDTSQRLPDGMRKAYHRFKWDYYPDPETVIGRRRNALMDFVDDCDSPTRIGPYVAGCLPNLPFKSDSFDLVRCSHLLFLYSEEIDLDLRVASLREKLRVSHEIRVFPLLNMEGQMSVHLEPSINALKGEAISELRQVPFEFRRGDSRMLRLLRSRPDMNEHVKL
jgi:hypothetical protein